MVEKKDGLDQTTVKIILGLTLFFAGLIGMVIVVGLAQKTLDPTGVATLLGGLFTGLLSAVVLLIKKGGGGDGAPPHE
jgi:hypothetical protein